MGNKQGRPPADPAEVKRSRPLRVSDREWDQWKAAAAVTGQTIAAWLRQTANKAAKKATRGAKR